MLLNNESHPESCGCSIKCPMQGYTRRFLTKAEKIERLKNYAEDLKKELKAVEEKIKEAQS